MTSTHRSMLPGPAPGPARGRNRVRRFALAALLVGALLLAVAAVRLSAERREAQRWKHGGDGVRITASITATKSAGLSAVLARLGAPSVAGIEPPAQMFVVHAMWKSAAAPGSYEFILLDSRVTPPQPIRGYDAWTADGTGFGPDWNGSYEVLAKRYTWLRRTASVNTDGDWTNDTEAFGYRTDGTGAATMTFALGRDAIPVGDPAADLTLAVAFVDRGGEVRWATKVPLETTP